jgi:hypothetical protein
MVGSGASTVRASLGSVTDPAQHGRGWAPPAWGADPSDRSNGVSRAALGRHSWGRGSPTSMGPHWNPFRWVSLHPLPGRRATWRTGTHIAGDAPGATHARFLGFPERVAAAHPSAPAHYPPPRPRSTAAAFRSAEGASLRPGSVSAPAPVPPADGVQVRSAATSSGCGVPRRSARPGCPRVPRRTYGRPFGSRGNRLRADRAQRLTRLAGLPSRPGSLAAGDRCCPPHRRCRELEHWRPIETPWLAPLPVATSRG